MVNCLLESLSSGGDAGKVGSLIQVNTIVLCTAWRMITNSRTAREYIGRETRSSSFQSICAPVCRVEGGDKNFFLSLVRGALSADWA